MTPTSFRTVLTGVAMATLLAGCDLLGLPGAPGATTQARQWVQLAGLGGISVWRLRFDSQKRPIAIAKSNAYRWIDGEWHMVGKGFAENDNTHEAAVAEDGTIWITTGQRRLMKIAPDAKEVTMVRQVPLDQPYGDIVSARGHMIHLDAGKFSILKAGETEYREYDASGTTSRSEHYALNNGVVYWGLGPGRLYRFDPDMNEPKVVADCLDKTCRANVQLVKVDPDGTEWVAVLNQLAGIRYIYKLKDGAEPEKVTTLPVPWGVLGDFLITQDNKIFCAGSRGGQTWADLKSIDPATGEPSDIPVTTASGKPGVFQGMGEGLVPGPDDHYYKYSATGGGVWRLD